MIRKNALWLAAACTLPVLLYFTLQAIALLADLGAP